MLGCRFYKTTLGNEPVREWLNRLGRPLKTEIGSDIRTVQIGWPTGKPLVDGFGQGLYEVRSTASDTNEYRILFFILDSTMILLHGLLHKTKKTPPADLALARKRQTEVLQAEAATRRFKKKGKARS